MSKSKSLFLGRFKGLRGYGIMREPSEMVTASRIQNIVEIRKKNTWFILLFQNVWKSFFGALGVEIAPTVGPYIYIYIYIYV